MSDSEQKKKNQNVSSKVGCTAGITSLRKKHTDLTGGDTSDTVEPTSNYKSVSEIPGRQPEFNTQDEISSDEVKMLTFLRENGITSLGELKGLLVDELEELENKDENDGSIISSIKRARLLLESLIEDARTVSYDELKKGIGIINKSAQMGDYLAFQNRGQTKSVMIPVQKAEQLHRVAELILVLNLADGKITLPEYLELLEEKTRFRRKKQLV